MVDTLAEQLEIVPEMIKPDRLAKELGVRDYKIPHLRERQNDTDAIIQEIIQFVKDKSPITDIGGFLLANEREIFRIFEKKKEMWRFLLYLHRDIHEHHPDLKDDSMDSVFDAVVRFYIFVSSLERVNTVLGNRINNTAKQNEMNLQEAEIKGAYGAHQAESIKQYLGQTRYGDLVQRTSSNRFTKGNLDKDRVREVREELWRRKLPFERIWVDNPFSEKNKSYDIEALNFFLCQNQSLIYPGHLRGLLSHGGHYAVWSAWIRQYIHLLRDTTTETYKVFLFACKITDGVLFDEHGNLGEMARENIPEPLKKSLSEANTQYHETQTAQKLAIETANRVAMAHERAMEVPPIAGVRFDHQTGILTFDPPLDPIISSVEVRIRGNGRGVVKGMATHPIIDDGHRNSFSIYTDAFTPGMNGDSWQLGKGEIPYRPGERYQIGLVPIVGGQRGKIEFLIYPPFLIPKPEKIPRPYIVAPPQPQNNGTTTKTAATVKTAATKIIEGGENGTPELSEEEYLTLRRRDEEKKEREDLTTAIEFFFQQDDTILMEILDQILTAGTDTLSFTIPLPSLVDLGYTQQDLTPEEIVKATSFEFSKKKKKKLTGPEIRDISSLLTQIQAKRADDILLNKYRKDLTDAGFSLSEMGHNQLLDILNLERLNEADIRAQIESLRPKLRPHNYHIFCKYGTNGINSFTLNHSNPTWSVSITFKPDIQVSTEGFTSANTREIELVRDTLLHFLCNCPKLGENNDVLAMIEETRTAEGGASLKTMRESWHKKNTATIIISGPSGRPVIIRGIKKEDLEMHVMQAMREHGVHSVGIIHRCPTYRCHGEGSIARPSPGNLEKIYADLIADGGAEKRHIIWERVMATFFNVDFIDHDHTGFTTGTDAHAILVELCKNSFGGAERPPQASDINDVFIYDFIHDLQEARVSLSYQNPLVDSYGNWAKSPQSPQ